MKILSIDQARHGAWAVFDYENKKLLDYGVWDYGGKDYTYAKAILSIETLVNYIIGKFETDAVFIEDIQMRVNVSSFKRLAQLQGVLVNLFEKNEYLYGFVAPSQWQNYCKACVRGNKEIKENTLLLEKAGKKISKAFSIEAVKELYDIDTENDNLADAILIGHYVVNNIKIENGGFTGDKK